MTFTLQELLSLVGRLDDTPGFDSPRERFRRFITDRVTSVPLLAALLQQCQEGLGDQHGHARQDLILSLGRFLGFEVTFGVYEPRPGAIRLEGHWRSRRGTRMVIEVRSERTAGSEVDDLVRTVSAMAATTPGDGDRWLGLSVLTPFYVLRRPLEARLAQREPRDIRSVSIESLLWLAEMSASGRLAHDDVLGLLTSGPDSDFMIDLMRRLTDGDTPLAPGSPSPAEARVSTESPASGAAAPIATTPDAIAPNVANPNAAGPDYWIASLGRDEMASAEQLLDSVIRRRQILGVSDEGPFRTEARAGDLVCFLIPDTGVVGHAQLDSVISDASSVIRGARRFTAVFRLRQVEIFDVPKVVEAGSEAKRIADRTPFNATGAVLSKIARADYAALIATPYEQSRAVGS